MIFGDPLLIHVFYIHRLSCVFSRQTTLVKQFKCLFSDFFLQYSLIFFKILRLPHATLCTLWPGVRLLWIDATQIFKTKRSMSEVCVVVFAKSIVVICCDSHSPLRLPDWIALNIELKQSLIYMIWYSKMILLTRTGKGKWMKTIYNIWLTLFIKQKIGEVIKRYVLKNRNWLLTIVGTEGLHDSDSFRHST